MSKPICVVSCPVDTYSGYGARSRDFVKSLIELDKYDVRILSQRWGNTRFGYLNDHAETGLQSRIVTGQLNSQPDLWIQITVPNEFQRIGKYNIGITAAMETTHCDPSWVKGVNNMDLTLVSSNHSKQSIINSQYEERDQNTNQVKSTIKVEKPIEVLFEGIDPLKYIPSPSNNFDLSEVKETFNFLVVGHWLPGILGEDRKNIPYTVKTFLETFKNKQNAPGLILKISKGNASILDREEILESIDKIKKSVKGKLPNVYLIHGDVTDGEMNLLYNNPKVKAMVSLTKGEGFGRPLLEFSLVKKPIIASGWSGHVDFLDPNFSLLIPGELKEVHKSALQKNVIIQGSQWFTPDPVKIGQFYKQVFKHYKDYLVKAKQLGNQNAQQFSDKAMTELLGKYIEKYVPEFATQVELKLPQMNLPKLKKVDSKPEIKLPKLKKL